MKVFARDAGPLPVQRHFADGGLRADVSRCLGTMAPRLETYPQRRGARNGRRASADVASPPGTCSHQSRSVVDRCQPPPGGDRPGGPGEHPRRAGYAGRLYTVEPGGPRQIDGDRCLASVLDLPEAVRPWAVIAVPAPAVLGAAGQCGPAGAGRAVARGDHVRPGSGPPAPEPASRCAAGTALRLVGPNCFGVAVPRASAWTPNLSPPPGPQAWAVEPGLMSQVRAASGGRPWPVQLSRLRHPVISSFASVGDKARTCPATTC